MTNDESDRSSRPHPSLFFLLKRVQLKLLSVLIHKLPQHISWNTIILSLCRNQLCFYVDVFPPLSSQVTRTENLQLSCSVTSVDSIYKVKWLYGTKPYANPEPTYGSQHNVTLCQDCEEPLREELFSCRLWSDHVVKLFPLKYRSEGKTVTGKVTGNNATTLTTTTRWSHDTGVTVNTSRNSEDPLFKQVNF